MVKTEIEPLSRREMNALLEASKEDPYYHMLFTVLKATGRRIGELYGVQRIVDDKINEWTDERGKKHFRTVKKRTEEWVGGVTVGDIEFENNVMSVTILKKKSRRKSECIVPPDAMALLKKYIEDEELKPEDHVFRRQSYRNIGRKIKYFAKKAKIKKNVTVHNCRHYTITELVRKGWGYDKIRKISGHAHLSTIVQYDHAIAQDIKDEAMKDLEGI